MDYRGMIILEDTRQQERKHEIKHKWFRENGVHWNRCTLVCGDYIIAGKGDIAVDTKKDIQELIGDIQFKAKTLQHLNLKLDEYQLSMALSKHSRDELYEIITADDSERFVEREISEFCHKLHIPEGKEKKLQDLYVGRHGFFHRGLVRAKNYGVKLHILVENKDGITSLKDLSKWENPRLKITENTKDILGYHLNGNPIYRKRKRFPNAMTGSRLSKACATMEKKYGCKFHFCKPEESGQIIMEILTGNL